MSSCREIVYEVMCLQCLPKLFKCSWAIKHSFITRFQILEIRLRDLRCPQNLRCVSFSYLFLHFFIECAFNIRDQ